MPKLAIRSLLLLACSLFAAGSANAQAKQTPENAQRFLSAAGNQHRPVLSWHFSESGWDLVWEPVENKHLAVPQSPTQEWKSKEGDVCSSLYQRKQANLNQNSHKIELETEWKTITIPWKTVGKVEQKENTVEIRIRDIRFRFIWPSEALATRAAYAMEFLRMYCDTTSDTGF